MVLKGIRGEEARDLSGCVRITASVRFKKNAASARYVKLVKVLFAGREVVEEMKISLIDRSLYYKGLMLLIRKDRDIHEEEKKMMIRIGEMLGFETDFCKGVIEEIMDNKHVHDLPPLFSESTVASCFIKDGLKLSASDGQIHEKEIEWLRFVAERNGLGGVWPAERKAFDLEPHMNCLESDLELTHFEWE